MDFQDFQDFFIDHQKNYNVKDQDRLALVTLGVAGEAGEVVELVKKYIRDGHIDREKLALEIGDVMAYLGILADYFDLYLEDCATLTVNKNKSRLAKNELQSKTKSDEKKAIGNIQVFEDDLTIVHPTKSKTVKVDSLKATDIITVNYKKFVIEDLYNFDSTTTQYMCHRYEDHTKAAIIELPNNKLFTVS